MVRRKKIRVAKKRKGKRTTARKPEQFLAKIKVIGIGGAGCNAVSRMAEAFPRGVELIAMNTDIQDLHHTNAKKKVQIGKNITKGLGTGMNPDLGRQSAEESRTEISEVLAGADLLFIAAGFGGGTGTGVSPVVAEIAREMGIVTVGIVTKPFSFEGVKRIQIAEEGVARLRDRVDTLITVQNDRIFSLIDRNTSLIKAFEEIDEVLKNSVFGITELINTPGLINVDFADVKTIIQDGGPALLGIGIASGADRSVSAANAALNSPLLELSIDGAKSILFSVSGHRDLKMNEVNDIAKLIAENVDPGARIIFGTYHDRKLRPGQLKVMVVATGFDGHSPKGNVLFPGLFSAAVAKKSGELRQPDENVGAAGPEAAKEEVGGEGKREEMKNLKGIPFLEKKNEAVQGPTKDDRDEIWEIPAFLRKKKRKKR